MVPVLARPPPRRRPVPAGLAAILPTDVPNLTLWLKADAGTFTDTGATLPASADGSAIARWNDQSGNGQYFTAGGTATPTLKTGASGINGLPVLRFDDSDDLMNQSGGENLTSLITAAEFCLFLVARPQGSDTNTANSWTNDALIADTIGDWGIHGKSPNVVLGYNYSTTDDHADATFTPGNVYGLRWRHTAGNLSLLLSGAAEVTVPSGNTAVITGAVLLGRGSTAGTYAGGDLAELFIYKVQPTPEQLTGLEAYLSSRYGIAW